MARTSHDRKPVRRLAGIRELSELDLPLHLDGRRVPPVRVLRRLISSGQDQAMDGCTLADGAPVCEEHASPGWLHVLDLEA